MMVKVFFIVMAVAVGLLVLLFFLNGRLRKKLKEQKKATEEAEERFRKVIKVQGATMRVQENARNEKKELEESLDEDLSERADNLFG